MSVKNPACFLSKPEQTYYARKIENKADDKMIPFQPFKKQRGNCSQTAGKQVRNKNLYCREVQQVTGKIIEQESMEK